MIEGYGSIVRYAIRLDMSFEPVICTTVVMGAIEGEKMAQVQKLSDRITFRAHKYPRRCVVCGKYQKKARRDSGILYCSKECYNRLWTRIEPI